LLNNYQAEIGTYLRELLQELIEAMRASLSRLIWIVIIPIVTLYLIADFDRLRRRAYHMIPDAYRNQTVQIAAGVTRVFARYLRGLFLVCVSYGIVLGSILGFGFQLPHAVVLGLARV